VGQPNPKHWLSMHVFWFSKIKIETDSPRLKLKCPYPQQTNKEDSVWDKKYNGLLIFFQGMAAL